MKFLEINTNDLKNNIEEVKKIAFKEDKNLNIIAVVKANGMGLDLIKYSKILVESGIKYLAVATVDEAIKLRKSGIEEKILMLSPVIDKYELEELIKNDITITIGSLNEFSLLLDTSSKLEKEVNTHIKIDTGFGRYGFIYTEKNEIIEVFKNANNFIKIEGMFSHFSKPKDEKWTRTQFDRFMDIVSFIHEEGFEVEMLHTSSTTAFLKYPDMKLNTVRVGSVFQGRTLDKINGLKKIGTFKSFITEIKELPKGYSISYGKTYKTKRKTKVAIVPVGYVDGLNNIKARDDFSLKNNIIAVLIEIKKCFKDNSLKVKIKGNEYKILGRLGMYHCVVDITNSESIIVGDEVELNIAPLQTNEGIRREYI